MSFAVTNVDDPAGKTVGRRVPGHPLHSGLGLQQLLTEVRQSQGHGGICRKGVYRFSTFEEADAWMMKFMVRKALQGN
ncbi:MAG: hypothetical protein ABI883_02005 [Chthoniobacterales bacterium]